MNKAKLTLLVPKQCLPPEGVGKLALAAEDLQHQSTEPALASAWAGSRPTLRLVRGEIPESVMLVPMVLITAAGADLGNVESALVPVRIELSLAELSAEIEDSCGEGGCWTNHALDALAPRSRALLASFGSQGVLPFRADPGPEDGVDWLGIVIADETVQQALRKSESGLRMIFAESADGAAGHDLRSIAAAALIAAIGFPGAGSVAAKQAAVETVTPASASGPLFRVDETPLLEAKSDGASVGVVVDLAAQKAYLLVNGRTALETHVCTGSEGHRTLVGTHRIGEKIAQGKRSNLYHCAVPYGTRLTHDGVGFHVGKIENRPASHGCIRLPEHVAPLLFEYVPSGTPVHVVAHTCETPGLAVLQKIPPPVNVYSSPA